MESENMAGVEETPTTETVEKPGILSLAELMVEDETPGGDKQEQPSGDAKREIPTKFNDLAGELGVDLDALYKLEVSQADDGTPVTIENLKDHFSKQSDIELRELEFDERRIKQESELLREQNELRELMAALPEKAIRPEVLQKVRDKHAAQMQMERQRTMELIPDWQDEKTRTKDIEGMAAHLQQYGYPVDHLERVADHRQLKYIRDNWQRETRIRKALEKVRAGNPKPTTRQKPARKAPQKRPLTGVDRGNARNKLEAVFSNID